MAEILDAKGYSVLQAENGQRALDVLKETPHFPCVVLLDLAMPVMGGREFLKLELETRFCGTFQWSSFPEIQYLTNHWRVLQLTSASP